MVFFISRLAPGDPLTAYYGERVERMNVEEKKVAMENLGLNEPIIKQYITWGKKALKGDFGISFKYKENVVDVIKDVYKNTLVLGVLAYLLTFFLALVIGIFSAVNEDKWIDKIICTLGNITNSIPSFWVSLILILLFSVNLKLLPSSGVYTLGKEDDFLNRLIHLILPIVVLVLSHLWYYGYMVRNKVLEEIKEDYPLFCRTKGLSKNTILYKHCLKNLMPSFINIMVISIPHIIGGTYVVEQIFSYKGLGVLVFESAKYHDYNMLLVLTLLTGTVVVLSNFLGEYIVKKVDPRMKSNRRDSIGA